MNISNPSLLSQSAVSFHLSEEAVSESTTDADDTLRLEQASIKSRSGESADSISRSDDNQAQLTNGWH